MRRRFRFYEQVVVSGEVDLTLTPGEAFLLREVRMHGHSAFCSGELAVNQVGTSGESFNYNVYTSSQLAGNSDIGFIWEPMSAFKADDALNITAPNTNDNTYGVVVVWEPVNT